MLQKIRFTLVGNNKTEEKINEKEPQLKANTTIGTRTFEKKKLTSQNLFNIDIPLKARFLNTFVNIKDFLIEETPQGIRFS